MFASKIIYYILGLFCYSVSLSVRKYLLEDIFKIGLQFLLNEPGMRRKKPFGYLERYNFDVL